MRRKPTSTSSSNQSKRKPGAQPGNTNAVTHGFYTRAFSKADQEIYQLALTLSPTDLTDEIATMRTRLQQLMKNDPIQFELFTKGIGQLARLAATHYHLSGTAAATLTDAMHNVLADIEATLGGEEQE